MSIPDEIQVEVFRTGDYGAKGTYADADLDRIAADYDPALHEAPVTFDHEQTGPAHGWVKRVQRLGDRLVATIGRVSEALHDAVTAQRFKKRSIELYRNFSGTGAPYLKAVSFLGAAAPEVKGLTDPLFAEAAQEIVSFTEDIVRTPEQLAAEAKQLLIERGLWRPEWEAQNVTQLFAALAGTPHLDALMCLLGDAPAPVSFGRMESAPANSTVNFAESLVGGASPTSQALHRKACNLLRENPSLTYRDALLKLS